MANTNLNALQTKGLIDLYHSELKKLEFQLAKTRQTIDELEEHLKVRQEIEEAAGIVTTAKTKTPSAGKRRGRPPKKASAKKEVAPKSASKPAKAAKSTSRKPMQRQRKLSKWDEFVITAIKKAKRPLISSEILKASEKENAKSDKMSDIQLKRKLNQVLHKLANKRGDLEKIPYEGKGFSYALPEWVENGKLKPEFSN
jgi:hypothetical protein